MAQSNESNYNNNNITLEDDGTTCDNDTAVQVLDTHLFTFLCLSDLEI